MKKLILLLIIIISTTIYSQVNVERSTEKTVINAKEYIVHRVKKGQTPYSISRAYGMPIKTLMLANDKLAKEFVLTIDQKLLIPIDQLDTKPNTSNLFKTKKVVQKDHSRYIYHTVKKGEWAHKIARDYNISFKVLTENNPNLDMINLKLGDEVKIPKTTSTKRKIFVSDDGMIIKTIVDGDTYKSIAAEYNIEESVLREYNAVDELLPGTVIRIPNEERGVATPKYKSYEYYTVKPKETLYRISKKFQIELKLLMRINNIKEDFIIKEGQVLKIPKIDIDKSTSQIQEKKWYEEDNQIEMKESDDPFGETGETIFVKHLVKKGETPYSISKTHGIPIQLLYDYNPESKNIISIGQTLRIPVDGVELNEQIDEIIFNKNNIAKKEESKKKIALFLPVEVSYNQSKSKANRDKSLRNQFLSKSLKFYKFYQGFVVALEEIVKQGKQIELSIFDTENDTNRIKSIIQKNELSQFDFIVGPIYNSSIKIVAQEARKHNIPVISPLSSKIEESVRDYNKFFLVNTPIENQVEVMVSLLAEKPNTKIILIPSAKEKKLAKTYENCILKYTNENLLFNKITNLNKLGSQIGQALSKDRNNVIIIASNNENTVTQCINDMIYYTKDYDMTLIGTHTWNRLNKNIDLNYLYDLNLTLFSSNNIEYESNQVVSFVNRFKDKYNCQPDQYSFRAYDVANFFYNNLINISKENPENFLNKINTNPASYGLQNNFFFVRNKGDKCFVNNSTRILRYDKKQYKIVEVDEIILNEE